MSVGPKLFIVIGLIALAGATLALLMIVRKPLQIGWHHCQMHQAWIEHRSGNSGGYRRFHSHVEAIVALGVVTKIEYRFSNLLAPTEESTLLFDALQAGKCPPLMDYYSAQSSSVPEPIVLTQLYLRCGMTRGFHDKWIAFLEDTDNTNKRPLHEVGH